MSIIRYGFINCLYQSFSFFIFFCFLFDITFFSVSARNYNIGGNADREEKMIMRNLINNEWIGLSCMFFNRGPLFSLGYFIAQINLCFHFCKINVVNILKQLQNIKTFQTATKMPLTLSGAFRVTSWSEPYKIFFQLSILQICWTTNFHISSVNMRNTTLSKFIRSDKLRI